MGLTKKCTVYTHSHTPIHTHPPTDWYTHSHLHAQTHTDAHTPEKNGLLSTHTPTQTARPTEDVSLYQIKLRKITPQWCEGKAPSELLQNALAFVADELMIFFLLQLVGRWRIITEDMTLAKFRKFRQYLRICEVSTPRFVRKVCEVCGNRIDERRQMIVPRNLR